MHRATLIGLILVVFAVASSGPAGAQDDTERYDEHRALAVSQAALGRQLGEHTLIRSTGEPVTFTELRGRPVVISMIFTSCYHTCPVLTRNLADIIDIAREALGEASFVMLSIGFDTAVDSPARMAQFALDAGIVDDNWYFLSGNPQTIHALSKELGFIYFASPRGFDHLTQTTIADAQGKIYRQIYGQRPTPPALIEPLKELVFDTPSDAPIVERWLDKVQLFCTVYDPESGRYVFDSSIFVSLVVGLLCLGAIATFIIQHWREAR